MKTPLTPSGRGQQSLLNVPISVLGLSFALLLVCSEVTSTTGGRALSRWSTCEVSLRLGVAGWERTTKAILFAKRLDQSVAASWLEDVQSSTVVIQSTALVTLAAEPVANAATSAAAMARRGQGDLAPPLA